MRMLLLTGALSLALGGTALAQMCGGGMQQSATPNQAGAMSCMGATQTQAPDPMAEKPAHQGMMGGMMCACCKNMAMMGGAKQGSEPQPKHDMQPKQ